MSNAPYSYWNKTELHEHLHRQAIKLGAPKWVFPLLDEALTSDLWDPVKDFDGCSVVQDQFHPCLACFIHDYLWKCGMGGLGSDKIFYFLMLLDGTKKFKAQRRWLAVRIGWLGYYKWGHFRKRNVNKCTQVVTDALDAIG
ncbi:MAG: hypothetical protein COB15_09725 [Flavobacteriales bacterium]|nr:MAG: hypothetical protein COB15_09725 [Flavobacteriales bacterium]